MNLLTVENMVKSYTDKILFNNASFSINENEKIGVIGVNGTGKSTLLKIVAGLERPEKGTVTKGNNVYIRYLPQNPIYDDHITVLQAVLEGNITKENQWSIESEAKSILNKLGIIGHNELIEHMSGGQKKRIALANTLIASADILILDEPTNHLDNEMSQWLEDYLKKLKSALIMVTHDRYFLDRVSNRIIEIDKGNIYSYAGSYSEFLRLKTAREDMDNATERKRQSILRNELAWISRGARARSTKQKARIERYEEMVQMQAPSQDENIEMSSLSSRLGRKTVEVNRISKSYDNKKLFEDFTYIFLKGDRVGIIGPNGCGKSTLLKIINGVIKPDEGMIEIGTTVKIGYFSQENEYMDENLKVIEYVREGAEYIETSEGKISASQMLERFLFDGTLQWSQIKKLSGGEKRRLYLLRILMEAPNVLLLDEPTNDLDIQTMTVLEDYLDNFDGIVITVSHDRYFLDRVIKRIFAFETEGRIRQFEGAYSEYIEQQQPALTLDNKGNSNKVKTEKIKVQKLKFTYQEQKDFETIDEEIAKLEEMLEEIDKDIASSATNFPKLNQLMEQKSKFETQLEEKMERWMYLTELKEKIEAEKTNNN
ncbi:ATP-binding cassette subfamily F protein uup [Lachnotalea glycerini]|uniref:ATP-binding cassette subfamily F protein uup n=1 Tax=Lachnotalea glycerini TaxID=1763509 RepID=A0A318ERY9_9FIRM|nr:ABC-F family ATP-binding cassette domain-containing protein [Lachnotalea glycerini]PXV89551.1 ATP-binding cassette subfamily F protein uup [Lachnotalea glycerini]